MCGPLADSQVVGESYVNLIPTPQGGTHVNGLRSGLTEALREFCEFRNLLPRGVRLAPEDVWEGVSFILSVKMQDPQFSGQTKERLSSRECAAFVAGVVKDALALWLNQHPETGDELAQLAISNAQRRLKASRKVVRKRVVAGPALPGKLADCTSQEPQLSELFPGGGRLRGRLGQAGQGPRAPGGVAPAGQDPQYLGGGPGRAAGLSGGAQHQRRHVGVDPGSDDLKRLCVTTRSAFWPMRTPMVCISLRCFAPYFCAISALWLRPDTCISPCRRLYRIDVGKEVYYALDDAERDMLLDRIEAEKRKGKTQRHPLQRSG